MFVLLGTTHPSIQACKLSAAQLEPRACQRRESLTDVRALPLQRHGTRVGLHASSSTSQALRIRAVGFNLPSVYIERLSSTFEIVSELIEGI